MAHKAIVGEKVGMTQIWDDQNRVIPVTVVRVQPVRVVKVKTPESDGYTALQVTYGTVKEQRLNAPQLGVFTKAGVQPGKKLVELRLDDVSGYEVAQELTCEIFEAGEKVDVTGISKGKGTAGGMKRHNFKGQGASHGNHKHHRAPGSVGATSTPGRVFKGWRMAGRMGHEKVTTLGLTVAKSDTDRDLLLIKGSVPGPKGATVIIRNATKVPVAKAKK
jgi:large subunit ribosomal protein L3